jgi:O-methyltransferase involved in polyketide biosynthesis
VNGALAVARLFAPRAPSLRHGLVQRHVMIDGLTRDHGAGTVLELAAGLSARGLRASADPAVSYVEVDRPEVVARKRALLERSDAGKAALARPNLRFVPGDVAEVDLAGLVPAAPEPLLVLVEGLLMYLDEAAQARLLQRLAALLAGRARARLVFDLVPTGEQPPPGLAARALAAIWKRATRGGEFVRDGRKREDVLAMLQAAGFQTVECLSPADGPARWKVPHLDRRTQQLVFVAGL